MVIELHNWFMCWYLEIDRESSYGVNTMLESSSAASTGSLKHSQISVAAGKRRHLYCILCNPDPVFTIGTLRYCSCRLHNADVWPAPIL